MSLMARREYYNAIVDRYLKASRKERSRILKEFVLATGYHPKYACHILKHPEKVRKPKSGKKPGRPSRYNTPEVLEPLKQIWLYSNLLCSKNLVALMPDWIPGYEVFFKPLASEVKERLLEISPATIDRLLKKLRPKFKQHGLSTTKPGSLLRQQIPIKTEQWNESRPGFLEADTVAHCGDSTAGTYINTLDAVDIATTWTEQRAIWGKGEINTWKQVEDIEASLPFELLGFDTDCGNEFFNWHLHHKLRVREKPVDCSTSRPYRKNDNAHVEQKNWTHVRQWLGYERLDFQELVPLLNDLYKSEWRLFLNFFIPSVKLISKIRIGSRIIKKHDRPKTPYQRILDHPGIPDSRKEELKILRQTLNPFFLRKQINRKIKRIFSTFKRLKAQQNDLSP